MQAKKRRARPRRRKEKAKQITTWPMYVIFIAALALFVLLQGSALSIVFGAVALLLLVTIIAVEFISSGKQEGYRKSIMEVVIALVIIVAIWFALRIALNTSDPIDVVPSCSMLPALQRGDLIVLSSSEISQLSAPIVNVSKDQISTIKNDIGSESLVCLSYAQQGSGVSISQFKREGDSLALFRFTGNSYEQVSQQQSGPVQYQCSYQPVRLSNGSVVQEAYTSGIEVDGITVRENLNNSIVVYRTTPGDYFYSIGDTYVVHRAYAILNASGDYYVLTKGDNNPALDLQFGNAPANQSTLQGRLILDIPYIGYFKILMSSQLAQPGGCNYTVLH